MRLMPIAMGLVSIFACASGADAANPTQAAGRSGVAPAQVALPAPRGLPTVLYSQIDNPANNGVPDQDFEVSFNAYDAEAADDFVVPAGQVWMIEQVRTVGTTGTPGGATVRVNFHTNNGALPGAIVPGCNYTGVVPTDTLGSFTISLPTVCTLSAGTYWVAVQTTQSFASFGQHFWSNRTTQSNFESAWRNPGDGFATGCLDWTAQRVCGVGGGASPDLLFEILGGLAAADLALTLTDVPDPVSAGGAPITYTATILNNGPGDSQDVAISLPTPAGTTFVSANPGAGGTCGTQPAVGASGALNCTWAGVTAAAASRVLTVIVRVPANTPAGTVFSASGTASSGSTDPTPGNDTATTTTTVATSADLSITLTDTPDPVTAGQNLTYLATATNAGPSDAQGVVISLPLPPNTTLVSATGGSCVAATCTFAGATAPGANRSVTYVASVAASALNGSTITASAAASSTTPDSNAADNTATTTTAVVASADLSITLTDTPDPVTAGQNVTYVATAANNAGTSDAQDVVISLPLPPNTTLVSATVAGGTCVATTCTFVGATAPGASRSVTYVVQVAASVLNGSTITATASTTSATTDPNTGNNSATTTTSVIAVADLALTLTSSVAQVLINVPVTFTAVSTNGGPSDAQNVSLTVTLTPDFRYSSHTATGATCTTPQIGNTGAIVCTWSGATAPGASRTLTVVAYSNNEGNTAVNASTTSATVDPVPNNNAASVSVVVGFPFNEIPTMSQYGLMLLGLLVGLMGFAALRRQA